MNKTVNINLAGIFFHIDEDAYLKLQRYLEAIKRSFTDSQGRAEIIADIEARIAELFTESVQNHKQVIGLKEVEEVIAIMGQPEDYIVDDEIFEDEPYNAPGDKQQTSTHDKTYATTSKKLYRDGQNSYIGGVASGIGHYLGVDAVWVRLLWILLAFGSGGTFIFIYILFWILVPEAVTTAEKLTMKGEPVNISNIEKKIKDGFDNVSQNVSDAVKNIDLSKQSNRIKSGSKNFFDAIGTLIQLFFKVIGKLIGLFLIVVGITVLIAMVVAFFSVGIAEIINVPGIDFIEATKTAHVPIWLMSLLVLLVVGIPFFFLFYLGLKILISNLKSIGNIAKFSLLGLWLIAIIALTIFGVKQASEYAENAIVQETERLPIKTQDTLNVKMVFNNLYSKQKSGQNAIWKPIYDADDQRILYLTDVDLVFKTTEDSEASIRIEKKSRGNSYQNAKKRAEKINYNYTIIGNSLQLDGFLTTAFEQKYRDQEIEITVFVPYGVILNVDENISSYQKGYYRNATNVKMRPITDATILTDGLEGHYLQISNTAIKCTDCPENFDDAIETDAVDPDSDKESAADSTSNAIKNNKSTTEDRIKVKIDDNGINITTDDV